MPLFRLSFRAMAADNEIQVHGEDEAAARGAAGAARDEVLRIEAKYSRYRADSVVSRINAAAGGEPVAIDEETATLLAFAGTCFQASGGLFDATSGILRRAWNFAGARVPTDAELAPLLALIGWRHVQVSAGTVRLAIPGMELDFGGFGKEYAVDRAVAILASHGIGSAMVDLAGDVAILGTQPGGSPWRVGIRHPRRPGAIVAALDVHSGAIATSGDYERFVEVDGMRHCHVLDPRTGRSARGLASVTVQAPSCLVAGSATTVAMLMGPQDGPAWLASMGVRHLCVREDGSILEGG
jgi:thiamine biosynthesis lipoprotein